MVPLSTSSASRSPPKESWPLSGEASRRAAGRSAFEAACEGVWLHGAAARLTPAPFTAGELALSIPAAIRSCL